MINLKDQCKPCNLKQGVKLRWDLLTAKLLVIYAMAKLLKNIIIVIVILAAGRYVYIDLNRGSFDTTILYQVWSDANELFFYLKNLNEKELPQ
jgi:hypothetical protein